MLVSLAFLVLIVLMSAGIAVIADNVGRKLGKKRMSFKCRAFSVRPKHVAMIGTALTGAAASILTIAVVTAASSDVREWIVRGRAAIAEAEQATQRVGQLQTDIRARESTISARDAELRTKTQEVSAKTKEISAKTKEVQKGRVELERQKKEIASTKAEIARLQGEIPVLRSRFSAAQARLRKTDDELRARNERLKELTSRYAAVMAQLTANKQTLNAATTQKDEITKQNTRLLVENGRLEDERKRLDGEIKSLTASRDQLQMARDRALTELDTARQELQAFQVDLAKAQSDLSDTQIRLAEARRQGQFYQGISTVPRIAPVTFRMQEEVARLAIPDGLSQTNAETAMSQLLRSARLEALRRGAKPNDSYPEAGIFERRDPVTEEIVSGEELQRKIVRQLVGSGQPLVLVAYSSLNAFKGEPVSLDVVVYPNPIVYRNGQLVAESRVDGRKDDAEIYRQVSDFVGAKLRDRAKQDRMLPRTTSEDGLDLVSTETLIKLVNDVKAAERPVRLLALAANDIRAGDALKLAFQVR